MALGMLAATGALVGTGSIILTRLRLAVSEGIIRIGHLPTHDLTADDLMPLLVAGGILVAVTAGPIALAAAGGGLVTTLIQTKFNLSTQKLKLHWERLSPSNGLQKLAPSKAGIDTLKTLITGGVIAYLAWGLSKEVIGESSRLILSTPLNSLSYGWDETVRLLWRCGVALLVLGGADIGLQKWRHTESLKMTLQEVKDEHKALEGKPETKAKIASIRKAMFRKRMLKAVPKATVIITNPTHFAVALEYNREKNPAPVVVAKGADLVAAKIREIGRSHSVPIIENPPLARALFKECELGDTIPGPLFNAVAEVLAYLIRIKQLVL